MTIDGEERLAKCGERERALFTCTVDHLPMSEQPQPAPKRKLNGCLSLTVLLPVLGILLFLAIWRILSPAPEPPRAFPAR